MNRAQDRGQFDWLLEAAGALAPATAAGFASKMLAPAYGFDPGQASVLGFASVLATAYMLMLAVRPEPRFLALADFEVQEMPDDVSSLIEALGMNELLLDTVYVAPDELLLDQRLVTSTDMAAVAELLLDDPLPVPTTDSRVVQLFAADRMPTAGQLQQRIDRHIAGGVRSPSTAVDGSAALSEALAELRRSLRQA